MTVYHHTVTKSDSSPSDLEMGKGNNPNAPHPPNSAPMTESRAQKDNADSNHDDRRRYYGLAVLLIFMVSGISWILCSAGVLYGGNFGCTIAEGITLGIVYALLATGSPEICEEKLGRKLSILMKEILVMAISCAWMIMVLIFTVLGARLRGRELGT